MGVTIYPPDWTGPPVEVAPTRINGLEWRVASDITPDSVKWLWPNRIPRGKVSLIGGFPNQGKSQIVCNLAAIITTGGDWPNGEGKCAKGAVMILAAEDSSKDMLLPRLMAAGADTDQVLIVTPMVTVKEEGRVATRVFNIEADLKRLEVGIEHERKHNNRIVTAVFVDPLNAYYGGGKNFDVHKTADMRSMLTPLSKWCSDKDIAVIGVAHFNKGSNSHLLYRITDSAAITAVCRAVWFAIQDEKDERYYFVEGKKNVGKKSQGIEYKIDDKPIGRNDSEGNPIIAPFIAWGDASNRHASEILNGGKGGHGSSLRDAATDFVIKALKFHGKAKRSTLEENAKEYGITPITLRRAIEGMNLKPIKEGFPAVVYYSLDVVNLPTDDLGNLEDPFMTNDEPDFG
jgi:putative DNA primase/helicase